MAERKEIANRIFSDILGNFSELKDMILETLEMEENVKWLEKDLAENESKVKNLTEEVAALKLQLSRAEKLESTYQSDLLEKNRRIEELDLSVIKLNGQISELKKENEGLVSREEFYEDWIKMGDEWGEKIKLELEQTKASIILSTENANRNGRPALDEGDIAFIKKLRASGLSYREIAKEAKISKSTAAKYAKETSQEMEDSGGILSENLTNGQKTTRTNIFSGK